MSFEFSSLQLKYVLCFLCVYGFLTDYIDPLDSQDLPFGGVNASGYGRFGMRPRIDMMPSL